MTRSASTARQIHLWRGCYPILIETPKEYADLVEGEKWLKDVEYRIQAAVERIKLLRFSKTGDNIILISGWRGGQGYTNTLRMIQCP